MVNPRDDIALPDIDGLSADEIDLLRGWSADDVEKTTLQQHCYARDNVHGHKRDVEPVLDPVRRGLLSESRVPELFEAQVKIREFHTKL